jgi:hypothetical protein
MILIRHLQVVRVVESCDELAELLDELDTELRGAPELVDIQRGERGDTMTIGLGRDVSVLTFMRADQNPPYMQSRADDLRGKAGTFVVFHYRGHHSEFELLECIPTELAKRAVLKFCKTGQLPRDIKWIES